MKPLRRAPGEGRPRWGLFVFTLLQLALAVGVPAGDAVLEAASWDTPVHVEAPTDEACAHAHDHLFCQLCRVLGLSGLPGAVAPETDLFRSGVLGIARATSHATPSGSFLAGSLGARAPPAA